MIHVGEHDSSIEWHGMMTLHTQFLGTHAAAARKTRTCPWLSRGGQGAMKRPMGRPPHTPTPWAREGAPPRRPSPSPPPQSPARGARTPAESLAWEFKTRGGGRHVDFSRPQVRRDRPTRSFGYLRDPPWRVRARGGGKCALALERAHEAKSQKRWNFKLI